MFDFSKTVDRRGTYSTQWDYIADRFGRADLLPFTISDMDFQTAPCVMDALVARARHGVFGYSRWNNDDFMDAILSWFERRFGCAVAKDALGYSPSIVYGVAKLVEFYSNPGDSIILQTPGYDGLLRMIGGLGRTLLENRLCYDAAGAAHLDFDGLERLAPRAKVIILCNPHNPTGRVWTRDELQRIMDIAIRNKLAVISDEAHMDIVFSPHRHTPIAALWNDYKKAALVTSIAKGFNAASLGGAYIIFNDADCKNRFLDDLRTRGLSSAPSLFITALIAAYTEGENWLDECIAAVRTNLDYLDTFLKNKLPEITLAPMEGTYLAWLDAAGLNLEAAEIQRRLINEGKLAIMGGEVYGETRSPHLRFNVACPLSKIEEAMRRMKAALGPR